MEDVEGSGEAEIKEPKKTKKTKKAKKVEESSSNEE